MPLTSRLPQGSIQAAFIAISSRIVGSTFRFLETLNPNYQKAKVISDPPTVFVREFVTISMAWGFALLTNIAIKPLAQKKKWSDFRVQFATAVIGTTIAESIGRFVAYRKALKENKTQETRMASKLNTYTKFTLPAPQPLSLPSNSAQHNFSNYHSPNRFVPPHFPQANAYTVFPHS